MAIDWIALLITASVGLAGGVISGVASSLLGRRSITKAYEAGKLKTEDMVDKLCTQATDDLKITVIRGKQKCFACGETNPKQSVFCRSCGTPLIGKKMCSNCQISLPDTAEICYLCGEEAINKEETSESNKDKIEELSIDEEESISDST